MLFENVRIQVGAAALIVGLAGCPDDRSLSEGDDQAASDGRAGRGGANKGKGNGKGNGRVAPAPDDAGASDLDGALANCTDDVDDTPPELQPHTIALWPPNHKFHEIAVEDCVSVVGACDANIRGEFIWASSDEPEDDKGDGHHAPDIQLGEDCTSVAVRSERQGPKDGRVYKLGVRVVDASGNASEAECVVVVDHDQRGVEGQDSGEAYRVRFDVTEGGPICDGEPDEPPTPPPPPPPPSEPPPPQDPT
jgi:hypothetical protein